MPVRDYDSNPVAEQLSLGHSRPASDRRGGRSSESTALEFLTCSLDDPFQDVVDTFLYEHYGVGVAAADIDAVRGGKTLARIGNQATHRQ